MDWEWLKIAMNTGNSTDVGLSIFLKSCKEEYQDFKIGLICKSIDEIETGHETLSQAVGVWGTLAKDCFLQRGYRRNN